MDRNKLFDIVEEHGNSTIAKLKLCAAAIICLQQDNYAPKDAEVVLYGLEYAIEECIVVISDMTDNL